MTWWWMSFCDPDLLEGQQFLGALLIEADNEMELLMRSHLLGLNPGGEVLFFPVPKELEHRIDPDLTYKLMTREEAESFDRKWAVDVRTET